MQYSILCGLVVKTTDSYTCGRWFNSYLTYFFFQVFACLFLEPYAGAIFNVLGCQFRNPVLDKIRSKNSFYGHPFPSAVSIRATK